MAAAPTFDPWVVLAAMASRTSQIRLGATVTAVSRRRPWKLAREVATLDQLSGGRAILGIGLGDGEDATRGEPEDSNNLRSRAEVLDEALALLAAIWTGQPVDHRGKHFTFAEAGMNPVPIQHPRVPIWVGGYWPK